MSPTAWFQQNFGKAVIVPGAKTEEAGQCLVTMDSYLHDVYGRPYIYTPAAIDVWNKGLLDSQGFVKVKVGQPILAGDFIFYDARVGAVQGHVDIASRDGNWTDFYAYTSNWDGIKYRNAQGFPTLHETHHNDIFNNYIVGYYRINGGRGADIIPVENFTMNNDEAKDLWRGLLHREPENDQVWRPWVGRRFSEGADAFRASEEWLTQNDVLLRAYPAAVKALSDVQTQLTALQNKPPEVVQAIATVNSAGVDISALPAPDVSIIVKFFALLQRLISNQKP